MPEKKKCLSYPMSLLRCQESTTPSSGHSSSEGPSTEPSVDAAETLRQVEERLDSKRDDAMRPKELTLLSLEQYQDEKIDLQKVLLYYESIHGRPVTREDKERARPLYDRYRQVKRGIVRLSSRTKESIELAPILEHEAMDFTLASPQHRGSLRDDAEDLEHDDDGESTGERPETSDSPNSTEEELDVKLGNVSASPDVIGGLEASKSSSSSSTGAVEINLGDLHALPIYELKDRKREAKDQKKKIRKKLREFEEKFEMEHGRRMLKEERGSMEQAYSQYKHIKAKLRLLEALLSKHDSR